MSLNLKKGGTLNLTKRAPALKTLRIGLGWDPRKTAGKEFDLDASAFPINAQGSITSESDIVFYNMEDENGKLLKELKAFNGAIHHTGDNRDGQGDGDDETIIIDVNNLPDTVQKVVIPVTIYDAESRGQNFGMVANAYARAINDETGEELARYDLSEDASTDTGMIFVELYRDESGDFVFKAVGQSVADGLSGVCDMYSVRHN